MSRFTVRLFEDLGNDARADRAADFTNGEAQALAAAAGHHDLALDWLTRARDARSAGIMLANIPGAFDALYADARFRAILGAAYVDAPVVD